MKNVSVERARSTTRLVLEATLGTARMRRIDIDSDADIMRDSFLPMRGWEKWCAPGQRQEEGLPVDHKIKGDLW